VNFGVLLLRIVLGTLLIGHGSQKLFGWFGGHGPAGTGEFFHSLGHRPGKRMAITAGLSEAGGGLLLVLGLFDPLPSAIIIGVMTVAASTHFSNGLWVQDGGYELPAFYAATATALAFTGPGKYSLDNAIGWDNTNWWLYPVIAVMIGVGMAMSRIGQARQAIAADTREVERAAQAEREPAGASR
jgi:putative oxidoreductase